MSDQEHSDIELNGLAAKLSLERDEIRALFCADEFGNVGRFCVSRLGLLAGLCPVNRNGYDDDIEMSQLTFYLNAPISPPELAAFALSQSLPLPRNFLAKVSELEVQKFYEQPHSPPSSQQAGDEMRGFEYGYLKPPGGKEYRNLGPFGHTILGAAWAVSAKYEVQLTPLRDGIYEAVKRGAIPVRHPDTGLPYTPDTPSDCYECISIADLNKWFADCDSPYRLAGVDVRNTLRLAEQASQQTEAPLLSDRGGESLSVMPVALPRAGAVPSDQPSSVRRNKLRTNSLDAPIKKAIALAGSIETGAVWIALRALAIEEERPFTGVVESSALCYTNDDNNPAKLTKDALRKRLQNHAMPVPK
jgi:hypothetical protein